MSRFWSRLLPFILNLLNPRKLWIAGLKWRRSIVEIISEVSRGNEEVKHDVPHIYQCGGRHLWESQSGQIRIIHLCSLTDLTRLFYFDREQQGPPGLGNMSPTPSRTRYCVCVCPSSPWLQCCRFCFYCTFVFVHARSHVAVYSLQQLLYTFDKQVCVSSCSLNKEETLLGEFL